MQIFEEYGDQLFTSGDDGSRSNSPTSANLTCCQALFLRGFREMSGSRLWAAKRKQSA
ncbi:hypothetical protein [Desulfosporosinus nitroreducens]|uniref:hypothetical protein n=1 Tax=Desulfosporosinus nitroreducens TaxID=2018668 RepID=UPI0028527706|nr:hypothetical protein [Desulfosporosinus nitroreducens]